MSEVSLPALFLAGKVKVETLAPGSAGERSPDLGGFVLDRGRYAGAIRELSKISNARAAWCIARQWIIIIAALSAAWITGEIWVGILAAFVVASRQHALGVIMHDATHYRLFTNRWWNDVIADIFCAFPIGFSTELYRRQHLAHHQYTNTDRDPYHVQLTAQEDWNWPKDNITCLRIFFMDLIGLHLHKWFLTYFQWSPFSETVMPQSRLAPAERVRYLLFVAAVVTLLAWANAWLFFLLLWVLPALTLLGAFFRIRTVAEHMLTDRVHELNSTQHVDGTVLERFLFAPLNINYHLAHHLFPSVPLYNLPRLHALLLKDPAYQAEAPIRSTYLFGRNSVLRDMLS